MIFRPTLILIRPEPQSRKFADDFRARFGADWPVILSPLTEIRFRDATIPLEGCDAIVFTSGNAVAAFARLCPRRDLPALCVGARTAEIAQAAGFDTRTGPGDAAALSAWIADESHPRRIAYPRGEEVAFDLERSLVSAGIETVSAVVYAQAARPADVPLRRALARPEPLLLPLFSPASARRAVAEMAGAQAPLLVAAMSARVAEAARPLAPAAIRISGQPDTGAMLDALAALIAAGGSA